MMGKVGDYLCLLKSEDGAFRVAQYFGAQLLLNAFTKSLLAVSASYIPFCSASVRLSALNVIEGATH